MSDNPSSQTQEELCFCPTFNSYSSDKLAETAAKIAAEEIGGDGDSGEFEFSLVSDGAEVFYDGQFGPIFPVFNRDLVAGAGDREIDRPEGQSENPIPSLKDLFLREREEAAPPSCSSSEADETEALAPGTYCVWRPKITEPSPSICKKSNSTGSASSSTSKRWKFLNLLRRSNSEGKDTYVFLTPKPPQKAAAKAALKPKSAVSAASPSRASAHEAFYVHSRAIKQGDKKKSYLPYRKDLVGFFANVNSLGRS